MPSRLSTGDLVAHRFYRHALVTLKRQRVPFLVGGAYALERYTGITRRTKDIDVFVLPAVRDRALEVLAHAGCRTEVTAAHWLAKAFRGRHFVDIIFNSGNALTPVDDEWFRHAVEDTVLGMRVPLVPPEEFIWSKAFVMERERYDGHDIAHVLRALADTLDWPRLLRRFGPHWEVLLSHLLLFGYIYPTERRLIPTWVTDTLLARWHQENTTPAPAHRLCMGTLLSRMQYQSDIEEWGYADARQQPAGMIGR